MTTPDFDEIARLGTSADELTQPINTPDPGRPINVGSGGRARGDRPAELDPAMVERVASDPTVVGIAEDCGASPEFVARAVLTAAGVPALVAEVERLRATEGVCYHQNAQYLAMMAERDEARRALADLRAGIEALADTKPGATGRALRALLAGSGEQLGEAVCLDGDATGLDGWCVHIGFRHRTGTPAPVVPDSPDVRERVRDAIEDGLCLLGSNFLPDDSERIVVATENGLRNATDAVLAVVGQGVTAEDVAAAVRPVADAISVNECRKLDDGHQHPADECPAAKAAITAALDALGIAVRPTGQEGAK